MEKKVFELNFKSLLGKNKKITLANPKDDINEDQALAALNSLVDTDIFQDQDGDVYSQALNARYVTRTVDTIYSAE